MSTQAQQTDFRRRLLDGLAESILEKGLAKTQVGDIVTKARTSRRTFYETFPDKESCFAELMTEWGDRLADTVRSVVDPEAPWEDQVDAVVDAYLEALDEDPALAATFTRELTMLGLRGVALQEEDVDRYVALLMQMTRGPAMRRAGVLPLELDMALMLIGGVEEVVDRAVRQGRSPKELGDSMKRMIKRVIAP